MPTTCDCAHDPATWAARVELACLRQGYHLTPLRRWVLDIFTNSAAPLGAYAILEELSRRKMKQIAPPTVYRTLDFFLEHGFVHKIESLNAKRPASISATPTTGCCSSARPAGGAKRSRIPRSCAPSRALRRPRASLSGGW